MKDIKYTIKQYLGSWRECRWCSDMVTGKMLTEFDGEPICIECNEERQFWSDYTFKYDSRTLSENDIITEQTDGKITIERKNNYDK